MSRLSNLGGALYRGEVSYDFVGRRRRWYAISGVILIVALIGLFGRQLNLGIEFKGGAEFVVPTSTGTIEQAREATVAAGVPDPIVTKVGDNKIRIQTPALTAQESVKVVNSLAATLKVAPGDIRLQLVGPSWGSEITKKAVQALIVFMFLVSIFLSLYFEWRMAVAALVALVHDLVITVGIYALSGFEVTPATVVGILTILGFSLYDTVVVFDKVKENTRGITSGNKMTYSEAANLALNQTLVRSINTSIVALLPVAAILIIGVGLLGAGTLKDLALALFVGTAAGTYSSIFVATPFLAQFKERQPEMKALAVRVAARRSGIDAKASARSGKSASGSASAVGLLEGDGSAPDPEAPASLVAPASPSTRKPAQRKNTSQSKRRR